MFVYKPDNAKVPIKVWIDEEIYFSDEGLIEQAENASKLPFVQKHIVILPDAHRGYGVPIGCVMACDAVISSYATGSDISCGILLISLGIKADEIRNDLREIMSEIRTRVPVGKNVHKEQQSFPEEFLESDFTPTSQLPIVSANSDRMFKSIGTLGGGK